MLAERSCKTEGEGMQNVAIWGSTFLSLTVSQLHLIRTPRGGAGRAGLGQGSPRRFVALTGFAAGFTRLSILAHGFVRRHFGSTLRVKLWITLLGILFELRVDKGVHVESVGGRTPKSQGRRTHQTGYGCSTGDSGTGLRGKNGLQLAALSLDGHAIRLTLGRGSRKAGDDQESEERKVAHDKVLWWCWWWLQVFAIRFL